VPVKLALASLALCLAARESCAVLPSPAFTWSSEAHHVRLDGDADEAEFLSLYADLAPGGDDALEALRLAVGRKRVFPPGGGFLSFDLDTDLEPDVVGQPDPKLLALRELVPSVAVTEAGLVLDPNGRLCLWRRVRVGRASQWLELLSTGLLRGEEPGFHVGRFPAFDERSAEMMELAWARGERFCSIAGDSLRVDMPSTGENAARLLAYLFECALGNRTGESESLHLATSLRDVEIGQQRLRLRLGPDESGWMRVHATEAESQAAELSGFDVASLREAGFTIGTWESLAARAPVLLAR